MPFRTTPLVTGEYYHLFNRGVNKQTIFSQPGDYERAVEIARFYQRESLPFRFSMLRKLRSSEQQRVWEGILKHNKTVEIVAYCFMPNHFHFLLRQTKNQGISRFLANWQISYSRYFNTKYDRIGPLFQGQFRAVRVANDSQLLHLSRYIHLNPFAASGVENLRELEQYPWSSLAQYCKGKADLCDFKIILDQFASTNEYRSFVFDRAAYQRELRLINDLLIEG